MNERQLSQVLIGLVAFVCGGFLFILLRTEPNVALDKRVTNMRDEMLAGHIGGGSSASQAEENIKIGEHFETFDGKAGKTESSWPHFRGPDYSNISKDKVALADSWPDGGPPVLWK